MVNDKQTDKDFLNKLTKISILVILINLILVFAIPHYNILSLIEHSLILIIIYYCIMIPLCISCFLAFFGVVIGITSKNR